MRFLRLRYSLQTFLIVVAILGALLGLFSRQLRLAHEQKQVLDDLHQLLRPATGMVYYDFQYSPSQEIDGKYEWPVWKSMPAPESPKDWGLGIDFWQRPFWVELDDYEGYGAKTDRLFELLAKLPSLKGMILRDPAIAIHGSHLRQFSQACNLEVIYWHGPIQDSAFAALGEHSQLRALGFEHSERGYLADVKSWHTLAKLSHLREFDAPYGPATDEAAVSVANCRGLWRLYLSDGLITDQGAQAISQLHELRVLMLSANQITSNGTREWGSLTKLQQLWLDSNPVDDRTLEILAKLPELRELRLNDAHFTGESISQPNAFTALEELWIGSNQLSPAAWKALAQLPKLKLLSIDGTGMFIAKSDENVGFEKLAALYIDGTELTPERWQAICQLPVVDEIRIIRAGNLDAAFLSQQKEKPIKNLMLQECELSREALVHLLKRLHSLVSLSLYRNNLDQADINAIRKATAARVEGFSDQPGRGWYQ